MKKNISRRDAEAQREEVWNLKGDADIFESDLINQPDSPERIPIRSGRGHGLYNRLQTDALYGYTPKPIDEVLESMAENDIFFPAFEPIPHILTKGVSDAGYDNPEYRR